MTSQIRHADKPHSSILPRAHSDAHQRFMMYGKIQPMHQPSWFDRLLGRR